VILLLVLYVQYSYRLSITKFEVAAMLLILTYCSSAYIAKVCIQQYKKNETIY